MKMRNNKYSIKILNIILVIYILYIFLPMTAYYLPQIIRYVLNLGLIVIPFIFILLETKNFKIYLIIFNVIVLMFLLWFGKYSLNKDLSIVSFSKSFLLFFIPLFIALFFFEKECCPSDYVWRTLNVVILVTIITTIIGNYKYPEVSRLLAGKATEEESYFYYRQNIGGYGFVYASVLYFPYMLKNFSSMKSIDKAINLVCAIGVWILVFKCAYTLALVLLFVETILLLVVKVKNKKILFFSVVVFCLFFLLFRSSFATLFYNISSYLLEKGELLFSERIRGIGDILSGVDLDGDTAARIRLYTISVQAFLKNPIFGAIFGSANLGGHSELLDLLGATGIIGFIILVVIIWNYLKITLKNISINDRYIIFISGFAFIFFMIVNTVFLSASVGLVVFFVPFVYYKKEKLFMRKTVVSINLGNYGSTGNIVKGIADVAKQKEYDYFAAYKASERNKKRQNTDIVIGTVLLNKVYEKIAYYFGNLGSNAKISTYFFLRKIDKIQPDIIHLHNLHSFYINLPMLFRYIKKHKIKTVWTLHDCWSFTGRCPHFQMSGCTKWKEGCNKCIYPQEAYPQSKIDNVSKMYDLKKKIFLNIDNMTIVTPSQWLADLVKQSFLKDYPVKVIHNGIDLNIFKPTESDFRKKYNIADNKHILLGVAFGWDKRKGLDVFIELAGRLDFSKYQIVLVGTDEGVEKQLPQNIISIRRTQNQQELAEIYTAAALFLNPTREDNYPTVNMEAIACGTPVLTFCTGGSPEIISEKTGVVVDCDDISAMEKAIIHICTDKPFTEEACLACAKDFDMNKKFEEYIKLYENIAHSS